MLSVAPEGFKAEQAGDTTYWHRHKVLVGELPLPGCARRPNMQEVRTPGRCSTKVTVYVPPVLRKKVICQCQDRKIAGFWKTVNKAKRYFT